MAKRRNEESVVVELDKTTAEILGQIVQGKIQEAQEVQQKGGMMPWDAIEALPDEKKKLLWSEIARQIVETPGIISAVSGLVNALKAAAKRTVFKGADAEAIDTFTFLDPYLTAELEENRDKYSGQGTYSELFAAALQRARAAGVDLPPGLQSEQMAFPSESITPAALIEQVKRLPVLIPQTHIIPNNALINAMQQAGYINSGERSLPVLPEKGITAYTMIQYGEEEEERLSEYERQVANAVFSLWKEAERRGEEAAFTIDSIYRAMPGGGTTPSDQHRADIAAAIEKLTDMRIELDVTEEMLARRVTFDDDRLAMRGHFFQITEVSRIPKHGSRTVLAYILSAKPIVLQYAEMTNQIISIPAKYLAIKKVDSDGAVTAEVIPMTAERQAITGYILRRIAIMKKDLKEAQDLLRHHEHQRKKNPDLPQKPLEAFRKQRGTILFDTLFKATDIKTDNRVQTQRNRDFCFDVLAYLKAEGYITGYSAQTKGRRITGANIELRTDVYITPNGCIHNPERMYT